MTAKLLRRFAIRTPSISYHEHNEAERTRPSSSSGSRKETTWPSSPTPGLRSSPTPAIGWSERRRQAGISVRAVPGDRAPFSPHWPFPVFPRPVSPSSGFLPAEGPARESALADLASYDHTVVLFESGTRIARLLAELSKRPRTAGGDRPSRDDEAPRGAPFGNAGGARAWASSRTFKGELTLVIGGAGSGIPGPDFDFLARRPDSRSFAPRDSPREPRRSGSPRSWASPRERSITSSPASRRARDRISSRA